MPHIHFNQILVFSPITHMQMAWAQPDDEQAQGLTSPAYWQKLAKIIESACFDGVFFADTMSVPDDLADGARVAMQLGAQYPRQDPFALIPIMAAVTRYLGFGVTLSTAGTPPFLAVRRLGTLDNLTGGRVAWNVVTSHVGGDFRALGLTQLGHDERYDQADEYMEICYRLWDAFPRDAIVADRGKKIFVDADRVNKVEYEGKYLKCHAYPVTMCSPQGRPLIFQAGQSGRGMHFATTHADAIYALQPRIESMARFVKNIRAASHDIGKTNEPKVFFGIQPVIGGTEAEALQRRQELADAIPIEAGLNRLSGMIGIDLGKYDLDLPLENIETNASRGLLAATLDSIEGRAPTVREAALHWGMSYGMAQMVGTPEQIATKIENYWRESGCYGFNISPTVSPTSIIDFAEQVVPILQKRGLMRTEYADTTFRGNLSQ
ncbi:NtaA/DmoA family FMN-dependent monooxygenase [Rhizobium leguminosarum]|uniref:NtaA/DmoA family FMN-dependent monooxygenase n=1 Tax=Rhizobium leguminosarum TaxID=384 RepID=UPI001C9845F8|nr:NtaA/DmoA family FMN-dependent monooxygenase [Rhizobium leguminosarum]MBY5377292.1 NtaA/DmoA family FMN-dependent monooxygenase [Rhizobium leguminosarum]